LMDACRIIAQKLDYEPKEPDILSFYKATIKNIQRFGRLYELGLIMSLKLKSGEYTKDMDIGSLMFLKGKLKLLPVVPKTTKDVRRIMKKIEEIENE